MTQCSIEGCPNLSKYVKTGWCQTHYHRWWRTGNPLGVKQARGASGSDAVSWKGDDITYFGAHCRVKRDRGSATIYPCLICRKPAAQWSYDHADANQKWATLNGQIVAYSTDPSHYHPLCRGCHLKRDRKGGWPRKPHCINEHPFDDVNTYIRPDGERNCRRCATERAARKRAELRSRGLTARGTPPARKVLGDG